MCEIALSRVEQIQKYSNKYLCKWLRIPPCFSKVGLYTNSGNLQLPISSLVEEFKIRKVRLHIMKDSTDEIIRKAYPEIKSGMKWSAIKAAQKVKCSLQTKDITGCLRRSKEQPLLLLRPSNVLEQNGMISNQLNYHGNP